MFFGLRVKVIGNFFYYALSFLLSYFWGSVNVDGFVKSQKRANIQISELIISIGYEIEVR
jgi:hypothetical protein